MEAQPEFQEEALEYYKRDPPKSLDEARKVKNKLRKKAKHKDATAEDKQNFNKALKYYNFLLQQKRRRNSRNQARKEENLYRKDFFKFAKAASNGTLEQDQVAPTYSKSVADEYYKNKYSKPVKIDPEKLSWFLPVQEPRIPYNNSTITPKDVKKIFKNKSPNTCPGEDGLLYGVLAKLPSTHHFLATLYNKTDKSGVAMDISTNCYLVLAHKAGEPSDPGNFRMLAMTSCLAKPYHEIKAKRMSTFMVDNEYIDVSLQKAYLEGINGCIEHIHVLQQIIQDAKARNRTVHIS